MTAPLDYFCLVEGCEVHETSRAAMSTHMLKAHTHMRPREHSTLIHHGEDRGYYAHRRLGEPFPEDEGGEPCGCRAAHSQAVVEWQRQWRRGYGFLFDRGMR